MVRSKTLPELSWSIAAATLRDLLSRQGALLLLQILQQTGFSSVVGGSKKMHLKTWPELGMMEFSQTMGAFVKTYNPLALDAKLTLTHWNDVAIMDSPFLEVLLELGFERGYWELTFWPSRRKLGRG
jgi:hypothetical protein